MNEETNTENLNEENVEATETVEMVCYPESGDLEYPEVDPRHDFKFEEVHFNPEDQEDKLWKARTGLNEESLCGAIETIIFMSDRPMSINKLKTYIDEDMPLRVLHDAIIRLQDEYEASHHGIRLLEVADGYQFRTKATYSRFVKDLYKLNSLVLSPSSLETLAIIAYKQPISRTAIDKIRGVDSSHLVRQLMDKRLLKVSGRSDELGRPSMYTTTNEFLEVFNLGSLEDLPPEHELLEILENNMGKVSDIKSIVQLGDKTTFEFDEMEELEELSKNLKEISADTEFTKTLKVESKKKQTEDGENVKSAFDLLEEYISNEEVTTGNRESMLSELFTAVTAPQVIQDLTAGPFNVPEEDDLEEEDEDFQMIDLDTGEVIKNEENDQAQNIESIEIFEAAEQMKADLNVDSQTLGKNLDQESIELSNALDDAFEKLTGEKLESLEEMETELSFENFDEKLEQVAETAAQIAKDAKSLDLDVSFLSESSEQDSKE